MYRTAALFSALTLTVACQDTLMTVDAPASVLSERTDSAADEALVLRAANELTFDELDIDAALDVRAAENIVEGRPFATIDELDAVPYVGPSALDKLYDIAVERFGAEEPASDDDLVLYAANHLSLETLDHEVPLDARAAQNIVDGRPFETIEELDAVAYVGTTALQNLLDYALVTWGETLPDCPAGTIQSSAGAVYTDLAEAMDRAPVGATLTLCDGTFDIDGTIEADTALTLQGQGAGRTILSGGRIVLGDIPLRIKDVTFTGGTYAASLVSEDLGDILLWRVDFEDSAGSIFADGGSLGATDCHFDNVTNAIRTDSTDVRLDGNSFTNIGGVALRMDYPMGKVTNSSFHHAASPYGAVFLNMEAPVGSPTFDFENVDFGYGDDDNLYDDLHITIHDWTTTVERLDNLVDGETIHCTASGCF